MIARNRLLLGLINESQEQPEEKQGPTIEQGVLEAPDPDEEISTPRQVYMNIIKLARKKTKKSSSKIKKKKKIVNQLIDFFEQQFPILDDAEDIF